MSSITANYWNDLNSGNPKQIVSQVQEQVNKVRRRFNYGTYAEHLGTQSEHNEPTSYTDTRSYSEISSSKRLALTSNDEERVKKLLDVGVCITLKRELATDMPESTPTSKKMSVPEWISYIRNDLNVLYENEQLADRISLLANDVETNEGLSIDEGSLATFIMFLSSNKIEKRPSVGLSSNGYIDALWRDSKDMLVEIIFLPGHESQIVTFSADLIDSEIINKRVATLPISNIMDVIIKRSLDSLFSYNKESEVTRAA